MAVEEPTLSPALLEANRRLHKIRSQAQTGHRVAEPGRNCAKPSSFCKSAKAAAVVSRLPDHLGWGSGVATAAIRSAVKRRAKSGLKSDFPHRPEHVATKIGPGSERSGFSAPPADSDVTIKLHPSMATGILRQEMAAPARIWLLLRHLDREGRGWLRIDIAKQHLTHNTSKLRVCSWRQLRNLLYQGQGVFWHRDEERLWLRSVAKVATALDVERLSGRPVALPVSALLGGIGTVRAHLYASFHSGRRRNNPISRRTLEEISGVPARTQREYEEIAGIVSRRNIAIGEKYTPESVEKRAWLHGTASFDFIDHHGRQGPEKRHYIAWHLPNSYEGCHERAVKGRMRKINREIVLVNSRALGNGLRDRLFHPHGAAAGKAYNRNGEVDAYWYSDPGRRKGEGLWHVLARRVGDG